MIFRGPAGLGLLICLGFLVAANPAFAQKGRKIEFNRDIRPILSENCFVCHGPDNNLRKAKLRLDQEENVYKDRDGYKILAPGDPQKSELFLRIATKGRDRMPPKRTNKSLTPKEVALIKEWIAQGGKYQGHWSFIPPKQTKVPKVKLQALVRNPIDNFILAELEKEGLSPSKKADKRTLVRRLFFDLTGLPPTPKDVEDFLNNKSPKAYEELVDRLLRSPHFGERMAVYWLDVVRYADTGGYHSDNHRDIYLYRDYVINAFNQNKPYDDFVVEQLAGDLLPNATKETKIASGFNRLLQTTEEGGAQPKEYTAKYAADRVRNTGVIFLGVTMGCAECHDHKFDPVTTKDFYQFAAFFADINERAVGRQPQSKFPTSEQQKRLQKLNEAISTVQEEINKKRPLLKKGQKKWEQEAKAKKYKGIPGNIANVLRIDPAKRNGGQKRALKQHYEKIAPEIKAERKQMTKLQNEKKQLEKKIPQTLISMPRNPRTVRVLPRGNWLDDSGEVVVPNVPESILPLETEKKRANRLDLANWVVDKKNPLTSRVFVNRLWQLYFGRGIVNSADDFGAQGTWPSHPELLDWLALEFQEKGWDIRHMIRLMVTSNTYRQTSRPSKLLQERDPYNTFFARQGRFRLDAEFIRDNALAISGLLVKKVGGPSVKPYQPSGYWQHLNFPRRRYTPDKGEDQYRRGLYTYWQRTFLHPSLLAFDAPTREECTVKRPRSNTPQQALVLLNDPTYVEAARVFAERVICKGGKGIEDRIQYAFQEALCRKAEPSEVKLLTQIYQSHLEQYQKDPNAAKAFLRVGNRPTPEDIAAAELAAQTSVTRVILNLHETITRN